MVCRKMYQISGKVIKFIENTMENWEVELTAGGKTFTEIKIQRGIFQGDGLLPLLFFIAMMPLKCTGVYKLYKSLEKINHLMYLDAIKQFAKNEKELETLIQAVRIHSEDVGLEFVKEKCVMLIMKSGKRHMTEGKNYRIKIKS